MRVTYTLRNGSRLPKPWLEIHNPTTLPGGLPGRAITLGGRSERSWLIRAPLSRRGHFRIEPLHIRTGDPFGFFEASATVGQGVSVVVYPRLEPLPRWRLPAASLEGSHASPERTLQTTPLATTVRPYAPGDSMNRIHWKSTARHGEIQVKEFDLEQTADAWIILDLQRGIQAGRGDESTIEAAVRAAASIADKALDENRAVGMTVNVGPDRVPAGRPRRPPAPEDHAAPRRRRGRRRTPLVETLIASVGRLRRGMTAVIITPSLDPSWVRPLAALRARGVACVVVTLDAAAYARAEAEARAAATGASRGRRPGRRRGGGQARAGPCATPSPSTSSRPSPSRRAGRSARSSPDDGTLSSDRRVPLARRPRAGSRVGLVLLLCLTFAWSLDDALLVLGRDELHGLPDLGGDRRRPRRVRRPAGRLGPLADLPHRRDLRGAARPAARRLGAASRRGRHARRRCSEATADSVVGRLARPRRSQDRLSTTAVRPPPPRSSGCRLGDVDVRELRGVRASPAAQRRRRSSGSCSSPTCR